MLQIQNFFLESSPCVPREKKTYTFEGLKFVTEGEKKQTKIILAFKAPSADDASA